MREFVTNYRNEVCEYVDNEEGGKSIIPLDHSSVVILLNEMEGKIDNAKNCLVCAPIADPSEIIDNTYEILNRN